MEKLTGANVAGVLLILLGIFSLILLGLTFPLQGKFLVLWATAGAMLATLFICAVLLLKTPVRSMMLNAIGAGTVLVSFIVPLLVVLRIMSGGTEFSFLSVWSVFSETMILMFLLWGIAFAGGFLSPKSPEEIAKEKERERAAHKREKEEEADESEYVLPGGDIEEYRERKSD